MYWDNYWYNILHFILVSHTPTLKTGKVCLHLHWLYADEFWLQPDVRRYFSLLARQIDHPWSHHADIAKHKTLMSDILFLITTYAKILYCTCSTTSISKNRSECNVASWKVASWVGRVTLAFSTGKTPAVLLHPPPTFKIIHSGTLSQVCQRAF